MAVLQTEAFENTERWAEIDRRNGAVSVVYSIDCDF